MLCIGDSRGSSVAPDDGEAALQYVLQQSLRDSENGEHQVDYLVLYFLSPAAVL